MARLRWDSRLVFIMAAVGSAVGLGNVWRFPYMAGTSGGAAFLIPYFLMLVVVGIPLLIAEFYIGQRFQRAAIQGYGSIAKWMRGLGIFALISGALVISYYAAVMAWVWMYTFASLDMPWAGQATDYFFGSVLQLSDGVGNFGGFVWPLVGFLALTWVAIYFCIFKGVKSVSKIIWVTMPLPLLLILVLVVRGVTLPGMEAGLAFYLVPDWSTLLDWKVWSAAASQIFFTLTLGFGVMVAYASFNDKKQDFVGDGWTTAILNSAISIVSGFAVFSTLGYMATQSGQAVADVAAGGPGLAFVVFPEALSLIPVAAPLFALLFFITLLTLGIDSAFSLVEAINAALKDRYKKMSNEMLSLIVCVVMFFAGLLYVTGAGLYYLDIVDHYVTYYGIVLVGLLTAIGVGWVHGTKKVVKYSKTTKGLSLGPIWSAMVKFFAPIILIAILIINMVTDFMNPYEGYPLWAQLIGVAAVIIPLVLAFVLGSMTGTTTTKKEKA